MMKVKETIVKGAVAWLFIFGLWGGTVSAAGPNVIVIITDDQGYGDLSCHGNPVIETPHLDRLHGESVRFVDYHVAPMCTPTRAQLMTGRDAVRAGATNVSSGRTLLRAGLPTMADVFRASGYRTGIFGKWHLGDNYPFRPQDRGFEETLWFPSSHINSTPDEWNNDYFDDTYMRNGEREVYEGYTTDVFFGEAIDWMKGRASAGEKFFCYIPTAAPHWPLFVPSRYREAVAKRWAERADQLPMKVPPQKAKAIISFLAMIENIDENVGRVDAFLEESGLKEDTVVVFQTDNGSTMGEAYFNAGMRGKKVTLWEGGHRVPCFVRWPGGGFREAGDVAGLTQVQDLLPTFIDLFGLERPEGADFDGISLAGVLRGEAEPAEDRILFVNYSRMPHGQNGPVASADTPSRLRREGAGVLWKRWRLLEDRELYDLESDPKQANDVMGEHPEVAAKMRAALDEWWAKAGPEANTVERVVIGHGAENPMMLTACEWLDVFIDQQKQVRRADMKDGIWHLEVAEPGRYRMEMRRWPRESGLALEAGTSALEVTDGEFGEGKALPIAGAVLRVGGEIAGKETAGEGATQVTFETALEAGPTTVQATFVGADGKPLLGAYYLYVERFD
ncbi:MAG: arylsulfatase [Verrucomicrobiota bacterium]